MIYGIIIILVSLTGIIYGLKSKNKAITIISLLLMALTVAVWIYFYTHPY